MSRAEPAPLAITGLTKRYRRPVLEGLSLTLEAGEIFALVGLNGAGKTTLFKLVLGLARADAGEAWLFGRPSHDAAARAAVSFLPERFQPSPLLTGREFVELTLAYYGERAERGPTAALADALAFPPALLDSRISTYSKGMGQKVGLISALLPARPLLVLDEPMSGLDPEARAALKARLRAESAAGRTVFFSSHMLADIDEICHRIGVLHDRRLIFTGTLAEFRRRHPGETLEAAFLGALGRSPPPGSIRDPVAVGADATIGR
jgi:ABC-2 type transport system ATP-binding protein